MTVADETPLTLHHLTLNETPYPPLESVQKAIADCIPEVHRYPQFYADDLIRSVAQWCDVQPESVIISSGSVGVALQTLHAFTNGPDDEVVYGWRAFDAYPITTDMAGARRVEVPLTPDGGQDLERPSGMNGTHRGPCTRRGAYLPGAPDIRTRTSRRRRLRTPGHQGAGRRMNRVAVSGTHESAHRKGGW
ncbi:aminotransferase class I/II-fold pyridoxal phosphate-dependent enzyme [Streptomyces sp. NPDC057963]|uniref:aminotransferase class I/II-fold pyridoxal phosphate-dependent enzyme n=1 Tax=Streptomyces sp. NPDC057963 TaxID=3346290 RepID=UPI0036EBF372